MTITIICVNTDQFIIWNSRRVHSGNIDSALQHLVSWGCDLEDAAVALTEAFEAQDASQMPGCVELDSVA
jgi:hypothetical protein